MIQSSNKLIIKDPFEMPAVDDTTVLVLRECADLVPHCWIWNESVGYLEVVEYSGYDIYVTVKNVGMKENATSGTIFPSCMEFLITAPNATPIIDNTVTCLRADFKCPTVGQEALMSVDSTSAIRKGDLIIVDTRYQYLVTEIINEHTMKVLNEEKGKEGGVINVNCNECVPVKIFESTHCCEALQEQVDDIYNRFDTKKSITPATDSLVRVSNGSQVLTDAFNDVVLDVDTDLSKYNNATSRFITSNDIPSLPDDIDLSHYDNTVSRFITSSDIPQIPTVNDATLTIYNSDGVTPFIEFSANASEAVTATLPQSGTNLIYFEEYRDPVYYISYWQPIKTSNILFYLGSSTNWFSDSYVKNSRVNNIIGQTNVDRIDYPSSNSIGHTVNYIAGINSTNSGRHVFKSGGATILSITEDRETVATGDIVPESDNSVCIGGSGKSFAEGYINDIRSSDIHTTAIHINDISHNNVATIYTYDSSFDFSSIIGVDNLVGSTHTISTNTITINNSYSHSLQCLIDVSMFISRLRVSQTGTKLIDVSLLGQLNVTNTTTNTTNTIDMCNWYAGQVLTDTVTGGSWKECCPVIVYTKSISLDANTTYDINASGILSFPGGDSNTICRLVGGVIQKGSMRITMIIQ